MFASPATIPALNSTGAQCLKREASAHLIPASPLVIHITQFWQILCHLVTSQAGSQWLSCTGKALCWSWFGASLGPAAFDPDIFPIPAYWILAKSSTSSLKQAKPLCGPVIQPGPLAGFKFRCYVTKLDSRTPRAWVGLKGARCTSGHKEHIGKVPFLINPPAWSTMIPMTSPALVIL